MDIGSNISDMACLDPLSSQSSIITSAQCTQIDPIVESSSINRFFNWKSPWTMDKIRGLFVGDDNGAPNLFRLC